MSVFARQARRGPEAELRGEAASRVLSRVPDPRRSRCPAPLPEVDGSAGSVGPTPRRGPAQRGAGPGSTGDRGGRGAADRPEVVFGVPGIPRADVDLPARGDSRRRFPHHAAFHGAHRGSRPRGRGDRAGPPRVALASAGAGRARPARRRARPDGSPCREAGRDAAAAASAPAAGIPRRADAGDPGALQRGHRRVHAGGTGLVLPARSQHEPSPGGVAGLEPDRRRRRRSCRSRSAPARRPARCSAAARCSSPTSSNATPAADRAILEVVPASNALFCPLKTEEETLGVVVATNRPGGFGQEEADAVTSFADAASLLIRNARLYRDADRARSRSCAAPAA